MNLAALPFFNSCLNATCAVLLATAYVAIRQKRVTLHRNLMVCALVVSAVFLTSYLYYHFHAGSTRYTGTGPLRTIYFAILISHTVLATAMVPFILRVVYLAARSRFDDHRRLARWVLPVWLYVSVTGVVIYNMLY